MSEDDITLPWHAGLGDSVLDDPRHELNDSGRTILSDDFPPLQGSVESVEGYRLLPVRVGHNPITGITLEVGPFDFGGDDIATLRQAIDTVDRIIASTHLRSAR